ncbi:MAG: acyltransferase family protein [Aliarcobacter sp.]|nr:acyltransferase family protein [Aliarcobacter sp.]
MVINVLIKIFYFFPFSFYFNPHNIEFVFGVILGLIIKDSDLLTYFKNDKLLIFSGIILFILNGINQNYILFELNSFITLMIYGISSFLIILGLIILEKNNEIKVPKLLILLGSASYSIYLIHVPMLSILHRVVQKLNLKEFLQNELVFISVSVIAIISGIILHMLIEKPIIKFLNTKFIKVI